MEKQKMKLGARILSKSEMDGILPNAESVYEQIAVFRSSISDEKAVHDGRQNDIEQKTNNIGIMGCRGAGKTSILKTFYHNLHVENEKKEKADRDIILPIIIPENMSAGTTLMDAVLGRLKSIVEERGREEEKDKYMGDCIYSGRVTLEQEYNELVKQYCYIKKDYRDILIQQFTTEQNYVDKTKKVFGSDSEFLKLFNRFLIRLLYDRKDSDKKTEENPMLFLFIDDVDLSIDRCMDIVRTLLIYLSNPRIVTFLSGDMASFEEELTLEFLRQDGALRGDVFSRTFYAVNGKADQNLLERKKVLAYQYLTKIIPPAYRRNIKYWALEARGNYKITDEDGNEQKSLAELLVEVTKEELGGTYLVYKEEDKEKCIGLAYHMFDDTSRGLNNVYNVLQELADRKAKEKNMTAKSRMLLYWRLIETVVDSKPLFAKYKSELLKQVIVLGQDEVKIDFGNAGELLYPGSAVSGNNIEDINSQKEEFPAADRFALYFLIEFAARLFSQEPYGDKHFELKNKIIQEYLSDETVDDKIAARRELIECLAKKSDRREPDADSAEQVLVQLLRQCDFIFVLHLIRYLGRDEIYNILTADKGKLSGKEIAYKIAYALIRTIRAVRESEEGIQSTLENLYIQMKETMLHLLSYLSLNPWVIYGNHLTDNVNISGFGMQYMNSGRNLAEAGFENVESYLHESKMYTAKRTDLLWAEYENRKLVYWIYYENRLRDDNATGVLADIRKAAPEILKTGLTKAIMKLLLEVKAMDQYKVRALKEVNYNDLSEGKSKKEKQRIQVIEQIDEQGLWNSTYAKKTVYGYLARKRIDVVFDMSRGRIIFDATELITTGAYAELKNCDKGVSGKALINNLSSNVKRIMFLTENTEQAEQSLSSDGRHYLCLEQVLIIQRLLEEFLRFHGRAQYGKKAARVLLMEVKELPLLPASQRSGADELLKKKEEKLFCTNSYFLKESAEALQKADEEVAIEDIRKSWYDVPNEKRNNLEDLIIEHLGANGKKNYSYYLYRVQKTQIDRLMRARTEETNGKENEICGWGEIESAISDNEHRFLFHSYLRYLQATNSDAEKAGARAEDIVKLVQYMLDSEIKADEKIQNEIYQILSRTIELTEEEFETLF